MSYKNLAVAIVGAAATNNGKYPLSLKEFSLVLNHCEVQFLGFNWKNEGCWSHRKVTCFPEK